MTEKPVIVDELPATHSEDGREVPEAVAYVDEHGTTVSVGRQGAWISGHDRAIPDCWDRLMTVAQHERIVAAKDAEISALHHLCDDRFNEIAELRAQPARQVGDGEMEAYLSYIKLHTDWLIGTSTENGWSFIDSDTEQGWRIWQARAALAPAAVVMPERANIVFGTGFDTSLAESYNAALDAVARLNRRAIPVELILRALQTPIGPKEFADREAAQNELRVLLGKEGEK